MHTRHTIRLMPRGFTLTEILIVIGLIVLIIAMAVPAFNFISGNRSIEGARNQIAAALGRARAEAISRGSICGVFFFRDTVADAVGLQVIEVAKFDQNGPEAYQAWAPGVQYKTTSGDTPADRVYAVVWDPSEGPQTPAAGTGKWIVKKYDCKADHLSTAGSPGGTGPPPLAGDATYWDPVPTNGADALDSSVEYLPRGVGMQLVNDTKNSTNTDRYLQTGMILFDEQGKFIASSYTITTLSQIGQKLMLTGNLTANSQVGVMLYEQQQLASQAFFTPGDFSVFMPGLTGPTAYGASGSGQEWDEEDWIQQNAMHLLIDRYTGNLMKVE